MNYEHLSNALRFYQERGYAYVEDAPWLVSAEAYRATKPTNSTELRLELGPTDNWTSYRQTSYPVASGEQSFIQLMLNGRDIKRACCITPCFRTDPPDDWHKPTFMKLELINAQDVDEGHLLHLIHDAASFFEQFFAVRIKKTGEQSYDLIEKSTQIELGSYGIRSLQIDRHDSRWIYGTGCAEPRLSTVQARYSRTAGR